MNWPKISFPTLPKVFDLTKRQKFVIVTGLLFLGILLSRAGMGQFLQWRLRVALFSLVTVGASLWAMHDEDFQGIEWLTLPILPTLFAVASLLVTPLLPTRVEFLINPDSDTALILGQLVQLFFLAAFIVGYYACLLTANIYNVAAVRSIQLLRVAHSVGFLITVATALLFFVVVASLHLSSFANFLVIAVISGLLGFQAIWSVNLSPTVGEEERNFSFLVALALGQVAWILSFWPLGVSVFALFLTAIFYELVGIIQYHLGEKLNTRLANEFIVVAIAVFFLTLLTTQWGN